MTDKTTDCGSVTPDRRYVLAELRRAVHDETLCAAQKEGLNPEGERLCLVRAASWAEAHEILLAAYAKADSKDTESGSVAQGSIRPHLDAVGSVIDSLGPDVGCDIDFGAEESRPIEPRATECRSISEETFYALVSIALDEVYGGDDSAMSEALSMDRVVLNKWRNSRYAPPAAGARYITRMIIRDAVRKRTEQESVAQGGGDE